MDFSIEQTDDYREVIRLYKIVYPEKRTYKFDWLYTSKPAGRAEIFLARDNDSGKVIGSYVIMPMRIWFFDRIIIAGQAIDGMVHPEYRRARIFNTMQERLHDRLRQKYEFLIGFPNVLALHPLLKAGAREFGPLATYSFPLTSQFLAKRPAQGNVFHTILSFLLKPAIAFYRYLHLGKVRTGGYRLEAVPENEIHTGFSFETIRKVHPVMTVRDVDFIRWRFFHAPTTKYIFLQFYRETDALGYIAIRFEHKAVAIVDFCIDGPIEEQLSALRLLIDYCRQRQAKSIHFQLSEACYCTAALSRAGFIRRKGIYSIILMPYSEESQRLQFADFFLTFADTDWL